MIVIYFKLYQFDYVPIVIIYFFQDEVMSILLEKKNFFGCNSYHFVDWFRFFSLKFQYFLDRLDQSVPSTSTAIARLSLEQVREEIKNKSNSELASSAGQAVGKSATALVAATAR